MKIESVDVPVFYDHQTVKIQQIINNYFSIRCQNVAVADILLYGKELGMQRVLEVSFERLISNRDLFNELEINKLKFANPLTALCHAMCLPDRSRDNPVAIMFLNKDSKLCCLIFNWQKGFRKFSSFVCGGSNDFWFEDYKFLMVQKV